MTRAYKEIPQRKYTKENLHECLDDQGRLWNGYGPAVDCCNEDDDGVLIAENGEYGTVVNYCPFCGYKAPKSIEELAQKLGSQ